MGKILTDENEILLHLVKDSLYLQSDNVRMLHLQCPRCHKGVVNTIAAFSPGHTLTEEEIRAKTVEFIRQDARLEKIACPCCKYQGKDWILIPSNEAYQLMVNLLNPDLRKMMLLTYKVNPDFGATGKHLSVPSTTGGMIACSDYVRDLITNLGLTGGTKTVLEQYYKCPNSKCFFNRLMSLDVDSDTPEDEIESVKADIAKTLDETPCERCGCSGHWEVISKEKMEQRSYLANRQHKTPVN